MGYDFTVRALCAKRAELAAELERLEAGADDLRNRQSHIDTTLAMFGIDRGGAKTIREPSRGDNARAVMAVIREAKRALTCREIAIKTLVLRKLDPENERLLWLMEKRVREILGQQAAKGTVVCHEDVTVSRPLLTWTIAR